jgi:2-phospho-L-lactate guanylyltransferase (CobY/MobA/RfbA family)
VRNTVGDHPGLAASGAGEYQQGALGVLDCLPLAGVQALKKIHQWAILTRVTIIPLFEGLYTGTSVCYIHRTETPLFYHDPSWFREIKQI